LIQKAVCNFYVALALVVARQAPEIPESNLKGESKWRARSPAPTPPVFRYAARRKLLLQLRNPARDAF
jgi:hypothetical protein